MRIFHLAVFLLTSFSSTPASVLLPECPAGALADVLFLVDGSWSVGRANFKYIRGFISATASAFQIGEDKTRVGVVQYGGDARVEFSLNAHLSRPAVLRAIGSLPYKGGDTMTGNHGAAPRAPGSLPPSEMPTCDGDLCSTVGFY